MSLNYSESRILILYIESETLNIKSRRIRAVCKFDCQSSLCDIWLFKSSRASCATPLAQRSLGLLILLFQAVFRGASDVLRPGWTRRLTSAIRIVRPSQQPSLDERQHISKMHRVVLCGWYFLCRPITIY